MQCQMVGRQDKDTHKDKDPDVQEGSWRPEAKLWEKGRGEALSAEDAQHVSYL